MKILPNLTWENTYFRHSEGEHYHICSKNNNGYWIIKWNNDTEITAIDYTQQMLEAYFKTGTWIKVTRQEYLNNPQI